MTCRLTRISSEIRLNSPNFPPESLGSEWAEEWPTKQLVYSGFSRWPILPTPGNDSDRLWFYSFPGVFYFLQKVKTRNSWNRRDTRKNLFTWKVSHDGQQVPDPCRRVKCREGWSIVVRRQSIALRLVVLSVPSKKRNLFRPITVHRHLRWPCGKG